MKMRLDWLKLEMESMVIRGWYLERSRLRKALNLMVFAILGIPLALIDILIALYLRKLERKRARRDA